jgi:ABC-type nitrate/sulfonate/bicarbonate transport system substrate-binding protein
MVKRWLLGITAVVLAVTTRPDQGLSQAADTVTSQLKWVTQAQFAGYYAAKAKGLYSAEKLDVTTRVVSTSCPSKSWLVGELSSGSIGCPVCCLPVTRGATCQYRPGIRL